LILSIKAPAVFGFNNFNTSFATCQAFFIKITVILKTKRSSIAKKYFFCYNLIKVLKNTGGIDMRRYDDNNSAERLRRRLQERRDDIEKTTKLRLSPFTIVSLVIILVLVFITRGGA